MEVNWKYIKKKLNYILQNNLETKLEGSKMEVNGSAKFMCLNCKKQYANSGGLWKHKQKCNYSVPPLENKIIEKENEMLKLQLQDKDKQIEFLQSQVLILQQQLLSKPPSYVDMSNNTINQNNSFNITVYLNETCKNAINLNQLIDYIPNDIFTKQNLLECRNIQELLTKGIKKGLDSIPQIERPIQTTDIRRHKFYYKINNEWVKNTAELDNEIVKNIKNIHYKNIIPLCIELNKETMENKDNDKLSIINNKLIVKSSLVDVKLDPIVNNLVEICKVDK